MKLAVLALIGCAAPIASSPGSAPGEPLIADSNFARAAADSAAAAPHDSRAAAVHAIATYVIAVERFVDGARRLDRGARYDWIDLEESRREWRALGDALAAVDRDLAVAAADPQVSLELCPACWAFDWNGNGAIDERDRAFFELEHTASGDPLPPGDPRRHPTFRLDVGDMLWARAWISFQRAAVDIVLAYRWSELNRHADGHWRFPLVDAARVHQARELAIAGLIYSDSARIAYLAETDDDREWLPNPHQHSFAMPLPVHADLYETWVAVLGDLRRLLSSEEGISLREVAALVSPGLETLVPDAYVDVGRMFREPADLELTLEDRLPTPDGIERLLRGVLGHGYVGSMPPSPLVSRLRAMRDDVFRDSRELEHKLQYLLWVN